MKEIKENMTCIMHVSVTFMVSYILVFEIKLMGIVRTSLNVLGDVSTSVPLQQNTIWLTGPSKKNCTLCPVVLLARSFMLFEYHRCILYKQT